MYNAELMAEEKLKRVLAVDWGEKRIGLAISDPKRRFARSLGVINHVSRKLDAKKICEIAFENNVDAIIMGVTYDDENRLTPNGRSANRLADEIASSFGNQVIFWDESFTTKEAKQLQLEKGISKTRRKGHHDDMAAVLLLEDYLEKLTHE